MTALHWLSIHELLGGVCTWIKLDVFDNRIVAIGYNHERDDMVQDYLGVCRSNRIIFFAFTLSFLLASTGISAAQTESDSDILAYLKTLSIEDLLKTKVTSVSKKPESLFDAAAAIAVISADDIRRTGARTLPDILRLVPGIQVGQLDGSRWEVGSRGFIDFFENKLLVLIDGRSMYTPLYSGVYWNSFDTILEDIDRIEVIRGPGATVWGANAVNGVINIITKNSAETQGGLVSTTFGTHEKPLISLRYGGKLRSATTYRVYAKGIKRDSLEDTKGDDAHDRYESLRSGVRLDSLVSEQDTVSFQAEIYSGEAELTSALSGFLTPPFFRQSEETEDFQGGHVLMKYQHTFSQDSVVDLQVYYDGYTHDLVVAEEQRDTFDFEVQHRFTWLKDHEIVWGAGVRWTEDDTTGTFFTSFDPAKKDSILYSAFLQDDITLVDGAFWVTFGSKIEHNDFSGFEVQPSLRLRFKPAENHLLWGAISRAVRTPSRSEQDIIIKLASFSRGNTISQLRLQGDDNFDSENLIAYELGYRWQSGENLSFDVATFYNDYDDLRGLENGQPFFQSDPLLHVVLPQKFANNMEGNSYGVELSSTWQAHPNLRFLAGYSWTELDLERKDSSVVPSAQISNDYPRHQFQLCAYYDFSQDVSINSELYYVDEYASQGIDDYFRFDIQVIWKPADDLELAVGGENLFNSQHIESAAMESNVVTSEIPTLYWLKATYRF